MGRLFVGSAVCTIGRSGNLILPDAFRATIACRESANDLYVYLHEFMECLVVVDEAYIAEMFERFKRQRMACGGAASIGQLDTLRRNFGFAAPTRIDAKGHVAIAPALNQWVGKARQALIVGIGDGLEVWDLDYVLDRGRADLRLIAALHLNVINARKSKGARREPSVQSIWPCHSRRAAGEPGLPLQSLHALLPRHDPIIDGDLR